MKNFILIALLMFFAPLFSFGQNTDKKPDFRNMKKPNFHTVQKKAERYFREKEEKVARLRKDASPSSPEPDSLDQDMDEAFVKGGRAGDKEYHRYKRWEWFWKQYSYPDGSFPGAEDLYKKYKAEKSRLSAARTTALPTWENLGPNSNTGGYWGMGRCRSISVSNDPNIYYVASAGGGVWKTINRGSSYSPLGDALPSMGTNRVRVVAGNPQIAYASITETDNYFASPSLGLYKTTDGGATWSPTWLNSNNVGSLYVNYFVIHPTNPDIIIVTTRQGIYRSVNGGSSFTQVRNGDHFQIHFHPSNPSIVYANSSDVYKSTDAGVTWTRITNYNKCVSCYRMGVTAAAPDRLYVGFRLSGEDGELYVSDNQGASFSKSGTYRHTQLFYVSQSNKDYVYSGWLTLHQSKNAGGSWTEITNWCCGNSGGRTEVHADFWEGCADPSNKHIIYFTNDGGVDRYNENTNTWERVSNGLGIRQFYEIGASQQNYTVVVGGSQDNGGSRRQANGSWKNTNGGDGTMALIDPSDDRIMYTQYINGDAITRSLNGWSGGEVDITDNLRAAGAKTPANWETPFHIHRNDPRILVAGYQDIYITSNRGDSWKAISQNIFSGSNVDEVAISPSDPRVIYASRSNAFRRTYDQGATWQSFTGPASGNINNILVHPTNPQVVYIAMSGGNGRTVYRSDNGGSSWVNLSAGIPNGIVAACLEYEAGSNEGLYVGTSIGVYYKNAGMSSFVFYGSGLPNTYINDIDISYANGGKVVVGTHGRGVWACDLYKADDVYREADNPLNTENGLLYSYYEGAYTSLPDFNAVAPVYLDRAIGDLALSFSHAADHFAVKYTGYIEVPVDQEYTFYLNSDDGSKMYIGNLLLIDNDGTHGAVEKSGSIKLKAGKHQVTIQYLAVDAGQVLELRYSHPGMSKQPVPATALYRTKLRAPENPQGWIVKGMDYKYYEYEQGAHSTLPDLGLLPAKSSGKIFSFSLDVPGRREDFFMVRYEGYIEVPENGLYHFYTSSDEGTKLYIGDQLVVNNDGLHGVVEQQGSIGLQAGKHLIKVDYMEYNLGQALEVSFRGPSSDLVTKRIIPSAVLVKVLPLCAVTGQPLTGQLIGTDGSWNNSGNTKEKVFDNDESTFFDAPVSQAWSGLDLGSLYTVTGITFHPRKDYTLRMVGGKFQGSNYADFSRGVTDLFTITQNPNWEWQCVTDLAVNKVRYIRYISPTGAYGNISEIGFSGTAASNNLPSVSLVAPDQNEIFGTLATVSITAEASDPDGQIDKVVFYSAGAVIGEDSVAPYSIDWIFDQPGNYALYAKAYDDAMGITSSPSVNISVSTVTQLKEEDHVNYVNIYPVPFENEFTVHLLKEASNMDLIDASGRSVKRWKSLLPGQKIQYGHLLSEGEYTLLIHYLDGHVVSRKIIKVN